jgi:hypothetical protein
VQLRVSNLPSQFRRKAELRWVMTSAYEAMIKEGLVCEERKRGPSK